MLSGSAARSVEVGLGMEGLDVEEEFECVRNPISIFRKLHDRLPCTPCQPAIPLSCFRDGPLALTRRVLSSRLLLMQLCRCDTMAPELWPALQTHSRQWRIWQIWLIWQISDSMYLSLIQPSYAQSVLGR